jgi:anti-anti-sigma factor
VTAPEPPIRSESGDRENALQVRDEGGPEGAARVVFAGELDLAGAERAEAALEEAQAPGATLDVDLRELVFMDSTGLKLIVACRNRAVEGGGRLIVTVAEGAVRRLLELTGVDAEVELRVAEPRG